MEHIIQMTVSIEDERIVKEVEENAEKEIIKNLTEKVENVISKKRGWYGEGRDYSPLTNMVSERISVILEENKSLILSEASKILADKLARSKAGKELINNLKDTGGQ